MTSARGPLGVIEASGACPHYVRFTPKADIVQHDRDVRFVPKADIEIINYRNGLLGRVPPTSLRGRLFQRCDAFRYEGDSRRAGG